MTTAPERPRTEDLPPDPTEPAVPRVLTNVHHGGHVIAENLPAVDPTYGPAEEVTWAEIKKVSTPFGYLFDDLRDDYPDEHLPDGSAATVVASLKALGTAMVEQPGDPTTADSTIPPIFTYWGQFVDHDLTANTDRNDDISITDLPLEPLPPKKVVADLRNLRQPRLNLDSVYGNGPGFSGQPGQVPYFGNRLEIGTVTPVVSPPGPPGQAVIPGDDLPRDGGKARIGDGRNDENLVVAQLHLAFLKFHNEVLDWFAANPGSPVTGNGSFARARQLVEWHYQWITVHDFLRTVVRTDVIDGLLDGTITPRFRIDVDTPADEVFMPLEYSVAAYRFGHSMVRGAYDWNENFGFPGTDPNRLSKADFAFLFIFTGNGGFFGSPTLPENWPAQFERMTGFAATPAGAGPDVPARFARRIDTHLAPPLGNLINEGNNPTSVRIRRILRRLAVRNLLRGYRLAIPTGQAVARSLGITPLSHSELLAPQQVGPLPPFLPSPVDDALVDGGFLDDTPLWFYVLREAEVLEGGQRLGPVGSRIVAETIIGQLRADPTSFLNQGWDPTQGVTLGTGDPVDSIIRFLRFAGMHP